MKKLFFTGLVSILLALFVCVKAYGLEGIDDDAFSDAYQIMAHPGIVTPDMAEKLGYDTPEDLIASLQTEGGLQAFSNKFSKVAEELNQNIDSISEDDVQGTAISRQEQAGVGLDLTQQISVLKAARSGNQVAIEKAFAQANLDSLASIVSQLKGKLQDFNNDYIDNITSYFPGDEVNLAQKQASLLEDIKTVETELSAQQERFNKIYNLPESAEDPLLPGSASDALNEQISEINRQVSEISSEVDHDQATINEVILSKVKTALAGRSIRSIQVLEPDAQYIAYPGKTVSQATSLFQGDNYYARDVYQFNSSRLGKLNSTLTVATDEAEYVASLLENTSEKARIIINFEDVSTLTLNGLQSLGGGDLIDTIRISRNNYDYYFYFDADGKLNGGDVVTPDAKKTNGKINPEALTVAQSDASLRRFMSVSDDSNISSMTANQILDAVSKNRVNGEEIYLKYANKTFDTLRQPQDNTVNAAITNVLGKEVKLTELEQNSFQRYVGNTLKNKNPIETIEFTNEEGKTFTLSYNSKGQLTDIYVASEVNVNGLSVDQKQTVSASTMLSFYELSNTEILQRILTSEDDDGGVVTVNFSTKGAPGGGGSVRFSAVKNGSGFAFRNDVLKSQPDSGLGTPADENNPIVVGGEQNTGTSSQAVQLPVNGNNPLGGANIGGGSTPNAESASSNNLDGGDSPLSLNGSDNQ